jgi:hypothetical protein
MRVEDLFFREVATTSHGDTIVRVASLHYGLTVIWIDVLKKTLEVSNP